MPESTQGPALKSGQRDKTEKMAELERLFLQVASGQGGSGDYTKEKYEFPEETLEELTANFAALQAGREATSSLFDNRNKEDEVPAW